MQIAHPIHLSFVQVEIAHFLKLAKNLSNSVKTNFGLYSSMAHFRIFSPMFVDLLNFGNFIFCTIDILNSFV